MRTRHSLCAAAIVAALGCGTEDPRPLDEDAAPAGPDGGAAMTPERYLALRVGAEWTYRVTPKDGGPQVTKRSVVEADEEVGAAKPGVRAYRVRTERVGGVTVSWQEDTGAAIVRHREQSFDDGGALESEDLYEPFKLRLDEAPEHLALGASWTTSHTERIHDGGGSWIAVKDERWTVEAVAESVTVPAGTFTTLRVRRLGVASGSDKTYWFARGVGKVKESGGGQVEELEAWSTP